MKKITLFTSLMVLALNVQAQSIGNEVGQEEYKEKVKAAFHQKPEVAKEISKLYYTTLVSFPYEEVLKRKHPDLKNENQIRKAIEDIKRDLDRSSNNRYYGLVATESVPREGVWIDVIVDRVRMDELVRKAEKNNAPPSLIQDYKKKYNQLGELEGWAYKLYYSPSKLKEKINVLVPAVNKKLLAEYLNSQMNNKTYSDVIEIFAGQISANLQFDLRNDFLQSYLSENIDSNNKLQNVEMLIRILKPAFKIYNSDFILAVLKSMDKTKVVNLSKYKQSLAKEILSKSNKGKFSLELERLAEKVLSKSTK